MFRFVSIFSIILPITESYGLQIVLLTAEIPLKSSSFPSIVLGGILSVVFYGAIHKGWIHQPLILRYFANHPIEYITTIMFFVGLAVLIVKYFTILSQRQLLQQGPILVANLHPLPVSHAESDFETVLAHEKKHAVSVLTERLKTHLRSLLRSHSASNLDVEIRNRAEEATARSEADYGLVRLILWAVPMLGFLGTVLGITVALDNLDLNAINESSKQLSAGLAVAFDTTGLAIALAVVLFFVQFIVHREESNLLAETDRLTESELAGRFEQNDAQKENDAVATIRVMLETISSSIERATKRQTSIWERSAEVFKLSLTSALSESMAHHAKSLVQAESELLLQTNKTAAQFSEAMNKSASGLLSLREETAQQTETIREILGTNSQLIQLEERLRDNLSTVAQVGNFEETVNSLAAAIHLLNSNRRSDLRVG
jgi:biopolymer transport protein ExbB/TolQ